MEVICLSIACVLNSISIIYVSTHVSLKSKKRSKKNVSET